MFITREALESSKLVVNLDDNGLSIEGTEQLPPEAKRNVHKIATQLAYTPLEHDELMSYVANVTIWRVLRGITSV